MFYSIYLFLQESYCVGLKHLYSYHWPIFFPKQDIFEPEEPWYWPERPKETEEEEDEEEEEEEEEDDEYCLSVGFLFVCLFRLINVQG